MLVHSPLLHCRPREVGGCHMAPQAWQRSLEQQRLNLKHQYSSNFELVPGGFILKRRTDAATDKKGVEKGKVTEVISFDSNKDRSERSSAGDASSKSNTIKKPVPDKGKVVTDKPFRSSEKRIADTTKAEHNDQPSPTSIKLSEVSDRPPLALVKSSEAGDRLPLTPVKSSKAGNFVVRLLKNLEDMNEDRDVSLARFGLVPMGDSRAMGRFAVLAMLEAWAHHLLDIFPYLMTCSKAKKVVIEKQVMHIKEMEKSLAKTKELVAKLEEGLVSAKAYLGLLNQDKEYLNFNGIAKLHQSCIEAAKAFGDEPYLFLP
ncbi:hypothetical protein SLEP1_g26300 [Rubroshorea leprosula]|uniref:Uncharacterized protein n=1 Tax=Rubroshorea leprosula TaxID=152421 RepID=A0AAV5JW59_9ROSI|nr:hypothetical protein SLEP1_g26300 [Rubroshorea leprosula]